MRPGRVVLNRMTTVSKLLMLVAALFAVVGNGTTRLVLSLACGETAKAFEARRFVVHAR